MVDNGASFPPDDVVDIVCGTLQAKLLTKELSSGTSRCIILGGNLLTPCDLQCKPGKATARNWKATICYRDQPLSRFLVSYHDSSGKHCCRFEPQAFSQAGVDPQPSATRDETPVGTPQDKDSPRALRYSSNATNELVSSVNSHELSPQLPDFQPVAQPNFQWGNLDAASFCSELDRVYREIALWKKNSFSVPRGSAGKAFVCELARLFHAIGEGSSLESIALKAIAVACALLLQKPGRTSKDRDHVLLLEQRMKLWKEGDLISLIAEGRAIQSRLKCHPSKQSEAQITRSFTKLMFEGKTRAALQLVSGHHCGGVLNLDEVADPADPNCVVHDVLRAKHPSAQPLHINCLLPDWADPPAVHPVVFASLDAAVIQSAALRTSGAAGPTGVDAHG